MNPTVIRIITWPGLIGIGLPIDIKEFTIGYNKDRKLNTMTQAMFKLAISELEAGYQIELALVSK